MSVATDGQTVTWHYQFGRFFVLNQTTCVSSTALQETRISYGNHSDHLQLVKF